MHVRVALFSWLHYAKVLPWRDVSVTAIPLSPHRTHTPNPSTWHLASSPAGSFCLHIFVERSAYKGQAEQVQRLTQIFARFTSLLLLLGAGGCRWGAGLLGAKVRLEGSCWVLGFGLVAATDKTSRAYNNTAQQQHQQFMHNELLHQWTMAAW